MFPHSKESHHFLSVALFGIIVFIAVIFLNKIPDRIHRGQQAIAAIQLLDVMRRPILAMEIANREYHLNPSLKSSAQANFEQSVATAQNLLKRYREASRYNSLLAKNVDTLSVVINKWIRAEQTQHELSDKLQSLTPIPQHLFENHQHLLDSLTLLAEGEAPIHEDIDQGQTAERLLQWAGAILVSYLFLLIFLFQRFRQREMLSACQAVKQAQTELQRRENYLSLTLDSIGDAVIATDAQSRIIRMNPVAETLTGWQQDDANGHPLPDIFRIINAHSRQPADNPVEKVLSSGKIIGLANHTVLIARDGSEYQIADSGAPIRDEKGKILGVILVFRDVTEDYRQREALRKSQHNLAEAQQLAHIGNWELDLVSDTLEWSDEIFRIFEIDPEQFQPSYESFLDIIHPDDRDMVNQAYTNSLESKAPYDISHRLLMKDGRVKYVREFYKTQFDDNGRPIRSIGVVQDISKHREIEDELTRTADEWKQAMDSIDDAIYLIAPDERVLRANRAFYQLTGLQPEQIIGQNIIRILHPEDEGTNCPVCRARKICKDMLLVMEADHPDNPVGYPLEVMLKVIRNAEGEPASILVKIHDLTRQREIEDKLRQHQEYLEAEVKKRTAELTMINQELKSFSYSVSHDLRSPLRAINGFANALSEDYADTLDDTANNYLKRISAGANRMSALIDGMLMLSRINRCDLNKNTCDLSAMAEQIQHALVEQYPHQDVEWQIQKQLDTTCDQKLIHIALENMLSNAMKYSGKKNNAVIEFGCERQDGKAVFYIRDNGAGFDMRYSDKLFGAFQRLHSKEFEGTGIGLATVQRIIHRHGGKIWAEAKVDRGATFYFTLD